MATREASVPSTPSKWLSSKTHSKDMKPIGLEGYHSVARNDIIEEYLGVVLLFTELNLKPLGHTGLALGVAISCHRQIEISRPEFGIDLGVDSLFYFLVQHVIEFYVYLLQIYEKR